MTRGEQVERAADWDGQWLKEPADRTAVDREERTPRWRGQERLVRGRLGGLAGLRVIEIGAGRGTNALLYARRGADVTLLDLSPVALEQAQALFESHGLSMTPVQGDVFAPPPELLGAFDVSMSFGLCEHFLGERRLASIAAHLALVRAGGLALVSVPNRHSPVYRLWLGVLKQRGSWPLGTEEPFSARELRELGLRCGGEPLAPIYGSFVASIVNHGVNQALFKLGRPGLPIPQPSLPVVDRMAYELLQPIVRVGGR